MTKTNDFVNFIVEATTSDGNLYRQQWRPIVLNLARKKIKGIYVRERALVLLGYLAESGIKRHKTEFCEYYEVSPHSLARIPALVKKAIATRLLTDMTPEIDYEVGELKAAAKKKAPAKRKKATTRRR